MDDQARRREEEVDAAWRLHRHLYFGGHPVRTPFLLARLGEAQNWRCCYRGCRMTVGMGGQSPDMATFEHVIPLGLGGADTEENLVVACYECNTRRGTIMLAQHFEVRAMGFNLMAPKERAGNQGRRVAGVSR